MATEQVVQIIFMYTSPDISIQIFIGSNKIDESQYFLTICAHESPAKIKASLTD